MCFLGGGQKEYFYLKNALSPRTLDITQARGSRINLQKPQILRDDGIGRFFDHFTIGQPQGLPLHGYAR